MAPLIAGVVSVEAVRAARRAERPPKLCPTRTMWLLLMIGGSSVASALANVWEVYSSLRSLAAGRKTRLIWGISPAAVSYTHLTLPTNREV